MPQWLASFWSPDGRAPVIAAIIGGVVVALLILFFLYRLLFGNRLRVPSAGRARQPRLGLVDAFWLDGQRQLVLVRRDSVEHLIMIGGPNDVLVESQIIRVAGPASAPLREREAPPAKQPQALPAAAAPVASDPD
jgi:flagellar protein FliO/FliZ